MIFFDSKGVLFVFFSCFELHPKKNAGGRKIKFHIAALEFIYSITASSAGGGSGWYSFFFLPSLVGGW
jgi:hypothetical protein